MQRANHHQVSSNVLFTRWFCTDLYETIEHGPRNIYFKYYFTRTKVVRHIEISIFNFCFSFPATYQILRSVITGVVAWCNRVAAGTRVTLKRRFTNMYAKRKVAHVIAAFLCAYYYCVRYMGNGSFPSPPRVAQLEMLTARVIRVI